MATMTMLKIFAFVSILMVVASESTNVHDTVIHREKRGTSNTKVHGFSEAEQKIIVDRHNEHRRSEGANDMEYIFWDYEMAERAQTWADGCKFDHNPSRKTADGKAVGENLYAGTGSYDPKNVVDNWKSEKEFYAFVDNSCQASKACGHYTQVVWAKTSRVGCGITFCPKLESATFDNAYNIVCDYLPAGNYKGVKPFKKGQPCESCPSGTSCDNGLCKGVSPKKPKKQPGSKSLASRTTEKTHLAFLVTLAVFFFI